MSLSYLRLRWTEINVVACSNAFDVGVQNSFDVQLFQAGNSLGCLDDSTGDRQWNLIFQLKKGHHVIPLYYGKYCTAYVAVKQVGGVGFQQKIVEIQAVHHLLAHSSSNNTKLGSGKDGEKPDTVVKIGSFFFQLLKGFFSLRLKNSRAQKLKLKIFFAKTQALFSEKLKKPENVESFFAFITNLFSLCIRFYTKTPNYLDIAGKT